MTIQIAMIRGINVSGHKSISMERLRGLFSDLGFSDVRTYIQSGNVLFDAPGAPDKLSARIEAALLQEFGSQTIVVLRSPAELDRVLAQNPFVTAKSADQSQLYVTFLNGLPAKPAMKALTMIDAGDDELRPVGREIYLCCRGGYGRTKLSNSTIERALGLSATTRNWKTVAKLYALARGK